MEPHGDSRRDNGTFPMTSHHETSDGHSTLDTSPSAANTPPSFKNVLLGTVLTVLSASCSAFTEPCLRLVGSRAEAPTLELMIVSYGAQAVLLIPLVAMQWRHCREVTRHQVVWLLGSGVMIGLLFTLLMSAILRTPISRVAIVCYLVAAVGLSLLAASSMMDHSSGKDSPHPVHAYISLVVSSLLLVCASITLRKECCAIHLGSYLFWLALVGTALALLEMVLFTAIWPKSVTSPKNYLSCFGFTVLFSMATISLHLALRYMSVDFVAIVMPWGILVHLMLEQLVPVMGGKGGMKPIAMAGTVILVPTMVIALGWMVYKLPRSTT